MGFWDTLKDVGLGVATGGMYTQAQLLSGKGGMPGQSQGGGSLTAAIAKNNEANVNAAKKTALQNRLKDLSSSVDSAPGPAPLSGPTPLSGPAPLSAETQGYKAKNFSGALPEFDLARKKANEQINAQTSQNQDALTRRFARLGAGGLQSGAFVKQTQQTDEEAARAQAGAAESIGAQEAAARRALEQEESAREFQSSEAMRGRNATREQFNAQAELQKQQFNAQTEFQKQQFNADQAFKDKVFRFDAKSKLLALDYQDMQGTEQAELERERQRLAQEESQFNKAMANEQLRRSGGILGGGGFLGSGIEI